MEQLWAFNNTFKLLKLNTNNIMFISHIHFYDITFRNRKGKVT